VRCCEIIVIYNCGEGGRKGVGRLVRGGLKWRRVWNGGIDGNGILRMVDGGCNLVGFGNGRDNVHMDLAGLDDFGRMSGIWVRAVRWDGMAGKHSWEVILEDSGDMGKGKKAQRARDRHNKQAKRYYL
jgi:hypothetical protein